MTFETFDQSDEKTCLRHLRHLKPLRHLRHLRQLRHLRWFCHSTFTFDIQRAILETCDQSDEKTWPDREWHTKSKNFPKNWKFSENLKTFEKSDNFCDLTFQSDTGQHSQFLRCFGQVMSPYRPDQISQRTQVSSIARWRCSLNVFVFVIVFVSVFVSSYDVWIAFIIREDINGKKRVLSGIARIT